MTRLIDAWKLCEYANNLKDKCVDANDIMRFPAEDAVPVIRCKDCKHWDGRYCHNQWWGDGHVYYTPPIKTEDGYCDWAEMKERNENK